MSQRNKSEIFGELYFKIRRNSILIFRLNWINYEGAFHSKMNPKQKSNPSLSNRKDTVC